MMTDHQLLTVIRAGLILLVAVSLVGLFRAQSVPELFLLMAIIATVSAGLHALRRY